MSKNYPGNTFKVILDGAWHARSGLEILCAVVLDLPAINNRYGSLCAFITYGSVALKPIR